MTSMLEALRQIEALVPDGRAAERGFPAAAEPLPTPDDADAIRKPPDAVREPVADHDQPYHDLAVNLLSQLDADRASAILFVAAAREEGNTAVVARLASLLAGRQGEVLAVDVDLSRPRLAEGLGITCDRGLADVLLGATRWPDVVQPSGIEGLAVLPGRPSFAAMAPEPEPPQIARLLDQLRRRYRLVLLDAGRMRPEEAVCWARFCEGTCLLVGMGETSAGAASGAAGLLIRGGGRLLGSVLLQKGARSLP